MRYVRRIDPMDLIFLAQHHFISHLFIVCCVILVSPHLNIAKLVETINMWLCVCVRVFIAYQQFVQMWHFFSGRFRNWFLFHFIFGFIRKSMLLFCISISCTLIKRNFLSLSSSSLIRIEGEETRKKRTKTLICCFSKHVYDWCYDRESQAFVLHKNYIFRFLNVLQSHRKTLVRIYIRTALFFLNHVSEGHSRDTPVLNTLTHSPVCLFILIALKCK